MSRYFPLPLLSLLGISQAGIYGITDAPSSQTEGPSCSCNWTTTWVDIMLVMDASSASGQNSLNEMWATASTTLSWLTVTRSTDPVTTYYTSRVGIVTYGRTATVYRPLGSVNNNDLHNIKSLPFNNENVTNLEAGIQAAAVELYGPAHRPKARTVIMVFAATFNSQGTYYPLRVAQSFIANGGILMVYNYIPTEGQPSDPTLSSIASPRYFFTSNDPNFQITDLDNALCDANCFCDYGYIAYGKAYRDTPSAGCYQAISAPANYARSSARCSHYNNGFLAFDESSNKTVFLGLYFLNSPTNFWIGLIWDQIDNRWEWADGTPLGSYQPWVGGSMPTGGGNIGCVYVNTNNQWVATDCRNSFVYVCEVAPCDSLNYCL